MMSPERLAVLRKLHETDVKLEAQTIINEHSRKEIARLEGEKGRLTSQLREVTRHEDRLRLGQAAQGEDVCGCQDVQAAGRT